MHDYMCRHQGVRVLRIDDHQLFVLIFFFFQAEDGIRDRNVTGVQTCALPISKAGAFYFVERLLDEIERAGFSGLNRGLHRTITRSEERRVGKECRSRWSRYD